MVTVRFKLSELGTVEIPITVPTRFERILELCAEHTGRPVGSVLAVRNEKVINLLDKIEEDDVIDVYPALSGG
ncbi:hypothetical protein [Desulforhopalus sp. 52FAK]